MIELKDLGKFYDEASNLDIEDALEAWEIDVEAFGEFLYSVSMAGVEDIVKERNPRLSFATVFIIGFEMGYKMSLEAELRRTANGKR
jgi:hypothetical protein